MTLSIVVTLKRHFLVQKRVVWAIKRKNRSTGSISARAREKKNRTGQSKKSQRRYISPTWGEVPTEPIFTKICTVVATPDIIMHANVCTEISRGYDITGGRISRFPIDSFMGLTTVQRFCAACDTVSLCKLLCVFGIQYLSYCRVHDYCTVVFLLYFYCKHRRLLRES